MACKICGGQDGSQIRKNQKSGGPDGQPGPAEKGGGKLLRWSGKIESVYVPSVKPSRRRWSWWNCLPLRFLVVGAVSGMVMLPFVVWVIK